MNKIITLPNGLRIAYQQLKSTGVVAIGIYVGVGSAYETKEENGISHFIEHMVFKGTTSRSAFQIADEMESIGAQINAFTSRECTAFYTISTNEHTEKCFEVLSDIFFNHTLTEENMQKEKGVVLEEINMCNDDPTDVCQDLMSLAHFGDTGLGRPILGCAENVSGFTADSLREYIRGHYTADNVVVSVAGNISESEVSELTDRYFASKFININRIKVKKQEFLPCCRSLSATKDNEQANIAFAFPSYAVGDKRVEALYVAANILGGGMSSRLFQRLREGHGLVYDVYVTSSEYKTTGMTYIYFATNPKTAERAVKEMKDELQKFKAEGITEKELNKGKEILKSGLIFGAERAVSVMRFNGSRVLSTGKVFNMENKLNAVSAVTLEDVKKVVDEVFDFDKASCSYVGKNAKFKPLELLKD